MVIFDLKSLDHEWQKADALELDYMLKCYEARSELTESAESMLHENLEREREERERERADRLEAEISELRGRSWWRRVFGL